MTIASAASVPGLEPAALLPSSHSFARPVGRSMAPVPMGQGAPPRQAPLWLEAQEPPLGRILVVEDEAVIALDLQRILREAGYRVIGPASSVAEAEQLLHRGRIDCAVLDVEPDSPMPFAVADRLAERDIPFIFVTGCPGLGVPERHGGRPTITRPYTRDRLLAAVEQAMSGSAEEALPTWYPVAPDKVSWPRVFPQL